MAFGLQRMLSETRPSQGVLNRLLLLHAFLKVMLWWYHPLAVTVFSLGNQQ